MFGTFQEGPEAVAWIKQENSSESESHTNSSIMGKIKHRRVPRYTACELHAMLDGLATHKNILSKKHSKHLSDERKQELWNSIVRRVNNVSRHVRSEEEIQRKLRYLSSDIKKKYHQIKNKIRSGDADCSDVEELTPVEEKAVQVFGIGSLDGFPRRTSAKLQALESLGENGYSSSTKNQRTNDSSTNQPVSSTETSGSGTCGLSEEHEGMLEDGLDEFLMSDNLNPEECSAPCPRTSGVSSRPSCPPLSQTSLRVDTGDDFKAEMIAVQKELISAVNVMSANIRGQTEVLRQQRQAVQAQNRILKDQTQAIWAIARFMSGEQPPADGENM